jgi:osmoprotectant transport system permease protein
MVRIDEALLAGPVRAAAERRAAGGSVASVVPVEPASGSVASGASSADVAQCYLENSWLCGQYWQDYRPDLVDALVEHLWLTVVSVAAGLLLAVPLALLARRSTRMESLIIGSTTIVYTIPSLALFSLLLPWTGLSPTTVIIGLALYSLTILVRNVLAGLRSVPDEVTESARGLGYGPARLLATVELPLALPTIMAGLRVATVSTVALVTIGSIVSYGGLGNLLLRAVGNQFKAQILAASLLCVVLAVVLDLLLVGVERLLTPWTRVRSA